MHQVARVLVSLLPETPMKPRSAPKAIDYSKFVIDKERQQQPKMMLQPQQLVQQENNSSDAQWFVRFGEVISKNTH